MLMITMLHTVCRDKLKKMTLSSMLVPYYISFYCEFLKVLLYELKRASCRF